MPIHWLLLPICALALAVGCGRQTAEPGSAPPVTLNPFNDTGIYARGERAGWYVTIPVYAPAPPVAYTYSIKRNNWDEIESGDLDLSSGEATIEVTIDEPAMLWLEVGPKGEVSSKGGVSGNVVVAGAAIAPTELQPVAPRPADFDAFWNDKVKLLKSIPENPMLTPKASGRPGVEYATIQMDHIHGAHVYGQIAKPKREGKFPALLILQWASPPYPLQKSWVTDWAAEGWLALNIEPHNVLPDAPQSYYDALPEAIKHYESIGNDDRDKCYFLQMYLADYRAADYLSSRPDWDGETLVVMGTSMGGQQSLCVAGLHPKITHVIVNEPAGCDTNGPLHGRQGGYPFFPKDNPKVMETALYFDAVNFASRIRIPSLVAIGFVDTSCPPAGIWTAFNQIQGPKEAVSMIDSPHNHLATPEQQELYTCRSAIWMDTLVRGEEAPIMGATIRAAGEPIPRTDANSRLAHLELVEKAKEGRIDVYFVGDSITRRWGTSDAQYAELLANWNDNFFGWNAGNFGWGADKVENILWRLQHGELEGLNPKIIVVQAGTNNVGAKLGNEEAKVAGVTKGIRAIVDVCQEKAPDAVIILTGIFPRNDSPAVMPTINKINENIGKLADGTRVRYLDVNDKLADADGKLFDGMMGDGLHPTVKGYQVWADGLVPIFTELLGPPAETDQAPPPTGDPSARSKTASSPDG